jgi:hypothetical protein
MYLPNLSYYILLIVGLACMQVKAWRARGKVPLSADVTAALVEAQLLDAAACSPSLSSRAETPGQNVTPLLATQRLPQAHQRHPDNTAGPVRHMYALTIVR